MTTKYNKLVRDKIPAYIKEKGGAPVYHVAEEDSEYWEKLRAKLKEEVDEFLKDENAEEIADILEVIEAICDFKRFDTDDVARIKSKKIDERGKFINRIILDES